MPAISAPEKPADKPVAKAAPKPDSFNLLEASNSGLTDVALNVTNGHTVLTVIDAKPGLIFDVEVGLLHGEQGDLVTPEIVYAGTKKRIQKGIRVEEAVLELPLNVTLPNSGKYQGIISFATKDGGSKKWKLSLSRAGITRPATLTIDQNTITPDPVTRPWDGNLFSSENAEPAFSLRLWEKNRTWPLNDINVRLDGTIKAPGGFNMSKDINLKFDERAWGEGKRSIPAEKQAEVTINFTKLVAGEYSIPSDSSLFNRMFQLDQLIRDKIVNDANPLKTITDLHEYNRFSKYALSFAMLSETKDPQQAKAIMQQLAMPPVSFGAKREPDAKKFMITAYFGAQAGTESGVGGYGGLTVPIGVEYSKGLRNGGVVSVMLAPFDFAHPVNQIIKNNAGTSSFNDIVNPGIYVSYGIKKYPLIWGAGISRGASLSQVQVGNNWQYFIFFGTDMPLFSFY